MKAAGCALVICVCIVLAAAQQQSELSGHVYYKKNNSPAKGVIVTIGNYSVVTDRGGYYKLTFLKPGSQLVSVKFPGRSTRSFRVMIGSKPTSKDFVIDW